MIEKVINFGWILDGFWEDFRLLWHHFSSSISDGFPSEIREGFWTDFGSKNLQNRACHFCLQRLVSDLGASWASRWPPEVPRGLQEGPRGSQEGLQRSQEASKKAQEAPRKASWPPLSVLFEAHLMDVCSACEPNWPQNQYIN